MSVLDQRNGSLTLSFNQLTAEMRMEEISEMQLVTARAVFADVSS